MLSSSLVDVPLPQSNILVDSEGNPRLTDFGLFSVMGNTDSVDGSTPKNGYAIRYCAPELLNIDGTIRVKIKPSKKSDIFSLSMVIVEVCLSFERAVHLDPDQVCP